MKKLFVALVLSAVTLSSLFALENSFSSYWADPAYQTLIRAIKENRETEEVKPLYEAYIASAEDLYVVAKANYEFARYLGDQGQKDEAKALLEEEKKAVESMGEELSPFIREASLIDYLSAHYQVTKDLGNAMENSNRTKKLLTTYPDEVYTLQGNGWRLIYTPNILGGSNKDAIEKMFLPLLEEKDKLSEDVLYSVYVGLATAYSNKNDWKNARLYCDLAEEIYYGEPTVLELAEKINKKVK